MIYRLLVQSFVAPLNGNFLRIDDFEDHKTTLDEAMTEFNRVRETIRFNKANRYEITLLPDDGGRVILTSEIASFDVQDLSS